MTAATELNFSEGLILCTIEILSTLQKLTPICSVKCSNFSFLTFIESFCAGGSSLAAMKRILRPGAAWDHLGYGLACITAMTPLREVQSLVWKM